MAIGIAQHVLQLFPMWVSSAKLTLSTYTVWDNIKIDSMVVCLCEPTIVNAVQKLGLLLSSLEWHDGVKAFHNSMNMLGDACCTKIKMITFIVHELQYGNPKPLWMSICWLGAKESNVTIWSTLWFKQMGQGATPELLHKLWLQLAIRVYQREWVSTATNL
jgi:hypothetical protein